MECYKKICSTRNKAKCSCYIKSWLLGTRGILNTLIDWLRHSCSQARTWVHVPRVKRYPAHQALILSLLVNTCINKYIKNVQYVTQVVLGFDALLAPTRTHMGSTSILKHTARGARHCHRWAQKLQGQIVLSRSLFRSLQACNATWE